MIPPSTPSAYSSGQALMSQASSLVYHASLLQPIARILS
jgi:hypothetical protein